jgi:thiol:disulfide interchange protein DsbD
MHSYIRTSLLTLLIALFSQVAFAQNPIKWSFTTKDLGNCQIDLIFTGILEEGWCTYSQFLDSEDGPVATTLNFVEGANYTLLGKAVESGEIIKTHDVVFGMDLTKFKHKAILTQRVTVTDPSKPITGYVNYMTCNDEMCLPPKDAEFTFKIPALSGCKTK